MDYIIDNIIDRHYTDQADDICDRLYSANIRRNQSLDKGRVDLGKRMHPRTSKTVQQIASELEAKPAIKRLRLSGRLRYETLIKYKSTCLLCGDSPSTGALMDIDHIKPVSKYPELVNDPDNLQVLCHRCNLAKYNRTEDDFR